MQCLWDNIPSSVDSAIHHKSQDCDTTFCLWSYECFICHKLYVS